MVRGETDVLPAGAIPAVATAPDRLCRLRETIENIQHFQFDKAKPPLLLGTRIASAPDSLLGGGLALGQIDRQAETAFLFDATYYIVFPRNPRYLNGNVNATLTACEPIYKNYWKNLGNSSLFLPTGEPTNEVAEMLGAQRWAGIINVISLDTAARQARERRRALHDEVRMLLAHGLLHLLGLDHRNRAEERRMTARTDLLIAAAAAVNKARPRGRRHGWLPR